MEINDLKNVVRGALDNAGQFALATALLRSSGADQISDDFLPGNKLRLSAANVLQPEPADTITIRGTGVDYPFKDMTVDVLFYLEGSDAAFKLTATGDATWTLAKGIPTFKGTLAAQIPFAASGQNTPPKLFLYTHAGADNRPRGLTFDGTIDLDAMTGGLAILTGRQYQSISGPIVLKEKGSKFYDANLVAPVSNSVNLGIATVDELKFRVGSRLGYNSVKKSYYATPFIELSAAIPFTTNTNGQSVRHEIPVSVQATSLDTGFRFSADLSGAIDAAIDELTSLTNGHGLGDVLPDNFQLSSILKLNNFFFDFNPTATNKVTYIGLGVQSAKPWQILHVDETNKDLKVDAVQLTFTLGDPFGAMYKSLTISGEFVIGDAGTIQVSMRYPGWIVQAALKQNTTLNLTEAVAVFKGSTAGVPLMIVDDLELEVSPQGFSLGIEVEGEMLIPDTQFGLERAGVSIESTGDGSTFSFRGLLLVGGGNVLLTADYPGGGAGWLFSGATGPGQAIPIGGLIQDLADKFGDITLPSAIASLVIENLHATFDTGRKEFTFGCESKFRADDTDVDITVNLVVRNVSGTYTKDFSGVIKVGGLDFTLHFVQNAASDFFVATYHPDVAGQAQDVKRLIQSLSSTVADYVPEGLTIELKDVLFAYGKDSSGAQGGGAQGSAQSKFIFGLDIGTGINLSNLPLVGQEFPADATVGVDDLQILFISKGLTARDVTSFNGLIPDGVTKLPVQTQAGQNGGGDNSATAVVMQQGFNVSALMNFGGSTQALSLPASGSSAQSGSNTSTTAGANTSAADSAKWFMLQKAFGPVYFEKVGVQYQDKKIWFLLSATLTAAGLSLSLDGLAVGGSLQKYMPPSFDLRGIGIAYSSGPVTISGAFLRQTVTQGGVTYDEYDGAALIKTEQLTLSAIGSYAKMDGHPSMFIYAVLDYPIGGPSFFFITGLAAGFGFNRALVSPTIEQVAQFPLVSEAVAGAGMPSNLSAELQKLRQYIPPEVGEYFLAVGIKFTSFKLVDSFALLTVSFGRRFEIDVLGLSTLIVPTPIPGQSVTPLAEVQMAVKASYVPDEGFLGISAQLTSNSFILSRNCHLTGGFAFWSWFDGPHKGDFVLTLGGYHPDYNPPAHYPRVPRLGFNWRVDSDISIKGDLYYALTASTLMAGGSLQATWESGSLKAWFSVGANFIIAWKPYHYDATMYVDIGVSYTYHFFGTHHLNVSVGADLHIWGPEFSGKAHIKLWIISFDITFGSHSSQTPSPIDWPTFKASFLPPDSQVCSLAMKSGLTKDVDAGWVVNPKEFTLVTNSVIPSTEAYAGANALAGASGGAQLGIAPMNAGSYVARHTITILKDGKPYEDQFDFVPVRKKIPAAMWGRAFSPSLNGPAFVENALAGYEIRPKAKPQAGTTAAIDPGVLQYSSEAVPDAFKWETFAQFTPDAGSDAERTNAIKQSLTRQSTATARAQLLSAFGLQAAVTITDAAADTFLAAPQTGALAA